MMSISGFVWKKLGQKILEQCDLGWWLGLASTCAISGVFIMSSVDCAFAQIISDGTLGNESSQVTGLGSLFIIRGGATRGTNLFHSFDQFSIPTGGLAFFSNNLAIQNIISRVTGSSVSNINGSITARGTANVFLINPNGIILGPNASLNIGGSFAATTANAIQFGDQGFFSASIPNIPPPLLTVNPSAFLFNQIAGQRENSITVQAKLSVPNGRSLLLLGGNVSPNPSSTGRILIDGRMQGNRDALRALNGRVELGGVAEPGTVGLDVDGNSLRLSFPDGLALADVSLTNQANVTANVSGNSSTGGGGIHLEGGQVTLAGESRITAQTGTNQNGGDINIRASQLILQDASQISASTIGEGKGGALTLRASEFVQLSGTDADGNASGLFSNSYGVGDAGELTIETGRLILRDGAQVLAATAPGTEGQGGTLTVNASESVELSGTTPNGYPSRLSTQTDGTGDAGNLTILTRRLIVQDGGQVSAITLGAGQGGTLTVNASDLVELSGTTITPEGLFLGGLATETIDVLTQDTGDAGALTISTRQLIVRDGAKVSAATATSGLGGPLTVNASESVDVSGGGRLTTETRTAADAGDLTITTGQLNVSDRGLVSASTSGEGDGGNLTVNASDSVTLSSNGQLSVATSGAGAAGNLTITTRQLSGQDSAQISASTSGTGTPGNIFVREADSVVLNNSSISTAVNPGAVVNTAGAEQFGNIDIQTRLLSLIDGASVSASTSGQGDAGSIFVRDAEAVSLSDSSISTAVNAGAVGQGGGIDIQTGSLSLNDEAEVSAATFGTGRAGSILVGATDSVSLSNSTVSTETSGASQAGNVRIDTRQLAIQDRGQVSAATSGSGQGGSVEVNASDFVALNSRGRLLSESKGTGFAGDVTLTTPQLTLQSDAEISASTTVSLGGNVTLDGLETLEVSNSRISASTQEGIAGNVTVNATESVQLSGTLEDGTPAGLLAEATAGGNARNLTINTRQLRVEDGAQATVSSTGRGTAGNLDVTADDVVLNNQARLTAETESGSGGNITLQGLDNLQVRNSLISASTEDGTAGNVTVNATESVQLEGTLANDKPAGLLAEATEGGNARNLTINTSQLSISNGAQATVSSTGRGTAGNLDVTADDVVLNNRARLTAETESGSGGNITLQGLYRLQVRNSLISASTEDGTAGDVTVNASESVRLRDNSRLAVEATSGGNAGNLTVETGQLSVDGAGITVSSPEGQAGNLRVTTNSVTLNRGSLTAETGKSGVQGGANITLNGLDVLLLQNESLISANALKNANGGNISIDTNFILALMPTGPEGSDIVANAIFGNGGQVNITAPGGLFGIQFRPIRTSFNDITASSEFGSAGIVAITGPNVDPSRGLTNLPTNFEQPPLENSCRAGGKTASSFVVTGRGGLPPSPYDTLSSDPYLDSLATPVSRTEYRPNPTESTNSANPTPQPIVEAQGWIIAADGTVTLTAQVPTVTPHSSAFTSANCQTHREGIGG